MEGAEESCAPRDADRHETELAQYPLPFLHADAAFSAQGFEDGMEAVLTVLWEFESAQEGVDNPAQDKLEGLPGAVPLEELLNRRSLVAQELSRSGLIQYQVDGVENVPP